MKTNLLNDLSNVLKKGASMNLLPKMDREWIGNDSRMDRQSLGKIFRYAAVLFMLFMVGIGQAWADCEGVHKGFWGSGQWNIEYYTYGDKNNWGPAGDDGYGNDSYLDLGIMTTLYLKGSWVKTWSDCDWKQNEVCWYVGFTNESMTYQNKVTKSNVTGDQTWSGFGINYDLIANAPVNPGPNTVYMYWRLDNYVSTSTSRILYTIPGFTTTSTSQTFDNTAVSSTNDKTISFGTHYGTALTTGNCSITGTNASEFSVRSINESGVTVRFAPTSAGEKSATLTITDAHSKTCTITLTGSALSVHEPGIYVSSGVGGYNKALTSYNNALYEWYGVYKNSSTNKILASQTSPSSNPTGANVVATFTNETHSNAGWMLAKIKANTSSSTSSAKDEFPVCSHAVQVDNATYFTFAVKGYSQVGILATDNNADRSKNKYLKVFIDGVDVTTSASASSSASPRHYSIDSAQSHVVTLYTTSTDKSSIWGISLKPARPRISATSMAGYTYNQGDVANTMTVTASPVVAGHTLTYTWYSNTSATMSGATQVQSSTSSSYTPSTANAGGLYYVCVVSEEGCNTSTTPWSGLITVNAAGYAVTYNNGGHGTAPSSTTATSVTLTDISTGDWINTGWKANVATTVGGETVAANTLIANESTVTLSAATTFTAQWSECTGPTQTSFTSSGVTDGAHYTGDALGTLTVTAAATNGGSLSYQWKQYDDATGKNNAVDAAGTNNAATYSIPNNATCTNRHYFCIVTESGCSHTLESSISGALTLTEATYSVTYNKNGDGAGGAGSVTGTVPSDATAYSSGDRAVVKGSGDLALSGKTFIGWNDAANGSGTYYSPAAHFAITANKTLYAQWRTASACPSSGTVFSLSMGSSVTGSDLSIAKGETKKLSSYATITQGAADFTNTDPSSDGKAKITKASTNELQFNGNAALLVLYLDCALEEGDEISFTGGNYELSFSIVPSRGTDDANILGSTSSKSYTIPAESTLIGKHIIYCWRKTANTFGVTAISITRPASEYTGLSVTKDPSAGSASDPTISATSVTQGSGVTVTAGAAASGYVFTGWTSDNGTFASASSLSTTFTPTANNAVATANYAAVKTIVIKILNEENKGGWVCQSYTTVPADHAPVITTDGDWVVVTVTGVVSITSPKFAYEAGGMWYHLDGETITESACYDWDGSSRSCDATAPTLVSSDPANGDTGEATSGTIVLTFSEEIDNVDDSKFSLTGATIGTVEIDGSDATKVNIAYSSASYSSTVTLATAAGAVSDAAGNASAALSSISFTTKDEPTLTALVSGTRYEVAVMVPEGTTITGSDQYAEGLSANTKFFLVGSASSSTTMKVKNDSKTVDDINFANSYYFGGAASLTDNTPTTKAIKFKLSGAGTVTAWLRRSAKVKLAKEGEAGTVFGSGDDKDYNKYSLDVASGGTYYIYATDGSTTLYAIKFDEDVCSAPTSAVISGGGAKLQHEAIELEASASGTESGVTTYTWYRGKDGEDAAKEAGAIQATSTSGSTYTIAECSTTDAAVYYCVISNGTGCDVTASTSISVTAAYTLTYSANTDDPSVGNMPSQEIHTPGSYTLSSKVPTRNGYTFDGWYYYSNYTGTRWDAGASFTTGALNETLYAKWAPNTYTITYNLNGASWASSAGVASYTVGTGATLPVAGDMTNTGYTFGGWYDNSSLTGSAVTTISTSDYGNKEFWAKWTENEYDVTYNANGGSGDAMSATHGHYVTISDNSYTAPSGKAFVEWNTANNGSGASYNPGDEIELTADLPLYAIWSKAIGTINWSVTKVDDKLYRGGGGYSVTAEINDASWDASASDASKLELTATEGVVLRNVTTSINASGKAQITANFDITTDVNANATKITFTLNVPENNGYAPIEDSHDEDLTNCTGGKTEVRFTSSNKNDAGDNFGDLSSGDTQMIGGGLAKMIATGDCKIVATTNKDGYRSDRCALVFKFSSTTTLDVYYSAGSSSRSFALYSFSSAKDLEDITTSDYSSKSAVESLTAIKASFANTSVTSSNPSVSKGVVATNGSGGGIKATYSSLSSGCYVLLAVSGEGYFYGFDADGGGGGGAVTPTLTWSGSLADADPVDKYDTDVDFTYTASQDKNSLGALTYSSSDATVATVNASGKVHILKAGTTTITANLAESGCYEEAEITYTLNVTSTCTDVAGTLTAVDNGCDGVDLTVSGHTGEGVNTTAVRWYKDGVYQNDAAYNNKESITVTAAGEWSAQTTASGAGHCVRNSNSVTVTARSAASATRIVNQWYVKNGRRTPDIALVQTTNAVGFYVKVGDDKIWDEANSITTGFGGCDFYLGADGIIYLKGQTSTGAAPSDLTAGDVTLKIAATGCGSNSSELSIVIHKQAATTAKSVAFVVDGTKGGAVTAFTASHATTSPLYVYLDSIGTAAGARKFTLTGRNAYWSTVDSTLKAHYSQFDIILITDDPSTNTVVKKGDDYKTKGYVNALGTLIDIRPILSMEAFVSRLTNWGSKGIKGNPTSPNPRQYEMRLQCKDHEIYSGLPAPAPGTHVWSETIGGEEYRHVIMIDSTKSPYTGWEYNSKTDSLPALQGFTTEAMGDLLGLGVISNGALQAGIERQEEPAARLLLLGVNAKALPNALTAEGKRVISNALTYLLKTNMEEVDDCSNYFTGKTDSDWNKTTNWSKSSLPNYETRVRILAPCVVSGVTAHVAQVDIVSSGESSIRKNATGLANCNGKLTINADGALIVEGKVCAADAPHFAANDLKPTTVNDLIINTSSTNQAALIFNNDEGKTQATVNLYSLGRKVSETNQFQYFAIPMSYLSVNPTFANETHGITIYTYVWLEATGWERRGYYTDLYAFEGIGITTDQTAAHVYTMKGTLASTKDQEIPITADGKKLNLIGNSWTAPIQISELEASDFGDASSAVEQTVYIYCAGHGKETADGKTEAAGQWLAIPFEATRFDAWEGLKVIPSMQAFQIKTAGEGTLTLDYDKHVRGGSTDLTAKLRAPQRRAAHDGVELMRIRVADSKTHTDLYLFEGDQFSDAFDNGWEANYRVGTNESAKLYARVATGVMSVAAMSDLEGTPIYFIPGQETEYTFTFGGNGMGYYLNDLKLQQSTLISEGAEYSFTYEKGDAAARFMISATPYESPQVTTGVGNTGDGVRAKKFIMNDKMYILVNGLLYDATGKLINRK